MLGKELVQNPFHSTHPDDVTTRAPITSSRQYHVHVTWLVSAVTAGGATVAEDAADAREVTMGTMTSREQQPMGERELPRGTGLVR